MTALSTLRRLALALGLTLTLVATAACPGSDDDDSPVVAGCDRFDECNILNAGVSADECVEIMETALDNATPSARSDWETLMRGCLEFETCGAFIQCVDANDL